MFDSQFMALPGITPTEYSYLQTATNGLSEQQLRTFLMIYAGKRKNPSDMLIFCIIGLFPINTRGLPGNLEDAYRAGIIPAK